MSRLLLDAFINELEAQTHGHVDEDCPALLPLPPRNSPRKGGLSRSSTAPTGTVGLPAAAPAKTSAPPARTPPPARSAEELSATAALLDIRVGKITKAWAHPDSDKLYCEEIDVGEGEPRSIASGLRAFYTDEQMNGAMVLVICNLPKRKLGGFPSNGMVLCASNDAHDQVVFVEPPPGAEVGERVLFAGLPVVDAATASQVKKKKMYEAIAPGFKTSAAGVAQWGGKDWQVGGVACTAPLKAAVIS